MLLFDRMKSKIRNYLNQKLAISQPQQLCLKSRYECLLELFSKHDPSSMIEIGVWRGDRTVRFLSDGKKLQRYVGFDLFEDMTDTKFQQESMGGCLPSMKMEVMQRIQPFAKQSGCEVELIAGPTEETLPEFVKNNVNKFDFVYIDGGHSIETIANDWSYAKEIVAPNGLIVFDDYYLNDDTRGAKQMIEKLLKNPGYRVRFFPIIEDIIEELQITMVAVWPQDQLH